MLPPSYFDSAAEDILDLYNQLDAAILQDVVRRLVKTGGVTDTARWQAQRLQEAGLLHDDIIREVVARTNASDAQVRALFQDGGIEAMKYDLAIYEAAGLSPIPILQSPSAAAVLQAGISKTAGYLRNLTMTTAVASQQSYIQAATLADMQVESGAFDYVTAIRNAVRSAAQAGSTVSYPTGWTDQLDVAVRRAVLTGVSQTAAQVSLRYADDMGCDLVETTAHPGARPSHMLWQGKVFSRSGGNSKYPDFVASTGYGTGAGLCGWNCRHSFFPFFEGLSTSAYPRDKLAEYKNKAVQYNGQKIKYYDATQMQRGMERTIRATKRELAGYSAGTQADDESVRNAMREDFNASAVKLKQQEAALRDFARQTGLDRQREREQALGFSHSEASRAVSANKTIVIQRQNAIIESAAKKASGMRGEFSITPQKIDTRSLKFNDAHINVQREHNVSDQEARAFIKNAKVSVTRWNGKSVLYFSDEGASYVNTETGEITTAFKAEEFDPKVKAMMEELKKHGK